MIKVFLRQQGFLNLLLLERGSRMLMLLLQLLDPATARIFFLVPRRRELYPVTARISTMFPATARIITCYGKAIDDASCDS